MAYKGAGDGFDHYNNTTDMQTRVGALQWSGVGVCSIVSPGRNNSGKALAVGGPNGSATATLNETMTTGYFGFAWNCAGMSTGANFTVEILDTTVGGTAQLTLTFSALGQIAVYRGTTSGTLIGASAANAFNPATFPFVEIGAHIDASTGWVAVEVEQNPVTWTTNPTNVNTKGSSASATFGGVSFMSPGWGLSNQQYNQTITIDDLRFNDTTTGPGAYPCNGFMGDLTFKTGFVNGNGTVTWTPLTGTNWGEVSETAFDGDTSYNATATVGNEDLFNLPAFATTVSTIVAVDIIGGYREVDAGGHTMTNQIKVGGTDNAGATLSLSTSYQYFVDSFAVNPTTSASWSLSDINSMEIGYKLQS